MRLILVVLAVCALLASASKNNVFSDSLAHLKELCRKGDSRAVEQVLESIDKPSKEALLESFRAAQKAGNYQVCRALASKLPRKWVLRETLKSKDFKSAKAILDEGSTNLPAVDEMFVDHCLKNCSRCEGVQEELKLLLKLPSLNTKLIVSILIGLINFELYNVDLFRVLLADGRFEDLFTCVFFFNNTMASLRAFRPRGNYHYDIILAELMSSPVWPQITADWNAGAHTYFISRLAKNGAFHSLKHYLLNNKVEDQQLLLCVSESLVAPLAFSPFVMSVLLGDPRCLSENFLTGLQTILGNKKKVLGSHPVLLENYMVLLSSLFRVKSLPHVAESQSLHDLYQELKDYLLVTRLKFMQADGIGRVPSDITRLIASAYISISGFHETK